MGRKITLRIEPENPRFCLKIRCRVGLRQTGPSDYQYLNKEIEPFSLKINGEEQMIQDYRVYKSHPGMEKGDQTMWNRCRATVKSHPLVEENTGKIALNTACCLLC